MSFSRKIPFDPEIRAEPNKEYTLTTLRNPVIRRVQNSGYNTVG